MNPELMVCRRLTAGLIFPPTALQNVNLNRLYADITERFPYQSLQHLPDGIRMANADGDCFVQQTRIQVNENIIHFQSSKEKTVEIFNICRGFLGIQQFLSFGVKLTAMLPFDSPQDSVSFIDQRMLKITEPQWELLGDGRKGTGLRIVLHQDGIHELKIEPFFNDPSQLYLELDVQHPEPFNDLNGIEGQMDAAYGFVFGQLKRFLSSMNAR